MTSSTYLEKNRHHIIYAILITVIFLIIYLTAMMQNENTSPLNLNGEKQNLSVDTKQNTDLSTLTTTLNSLKIRLKKFEKNQQWLTQELTLKLPKKNTQQVASFTDTDHEVYNTMEESEKTQQNDIDINETAFQQEEIDEDWSATMDDQINTQLNELEVFDTILDKLDCRTSTCRIEFVHPEGTGQDTFIESMMASKVFSGEFQVHNIPNDQGEEITMVYLARPEENLFANE